MQSQEETSKKPILKVSKDSKIQMSITKHTPGYDGHSLRAYSYFGDQMPDIDPTSVESINSIEDKYEHLRQASKNPTFLLTYGGSYHGLMNSLGWPEDKAKELEKRYHALYTVSDQWVIENMRVASGRGYVELAFGLRLRTPALVKSVLGASVSPYSVEAEKRSAGNALGQSYGQLNDRAINEVMEKVRASKFKEDILFVVPIHDAGYYLVRDEPEALHFLNKHATEAALWQELPEIKDDLVPLGGSLGVFHPHWAGKEYELPTDATIEQISSILEEIHNGEES